MKHTIGELAGKVYSFLEKEGKSSVSEIGKKVSGSRSKVNMAIGWLAKEDKLEFIDEGRGTGIKLK